MKTGGIEWAEWVFVFGFSNVIKRALVSFGEQKSQPTGHPIDGCQVRRVDMNGAVGPLCRSL